MRKLILVFTLLLTLSGCSFFHVHKMDIEQGNTLTPQMVNRVHLGMTKAQVVDILGSPVLVNIFDNRRMDYVYTYVPGYGPSTSKYVTFIFRHGRVVDIKGNMYSQFIK